MRFHYFTHFMTSTFPYSNLFLPHLLLGKAGAHLYAPLTILFRYDV